MQSTYTDIDNNSSSVISLDLDKTIYLEIAKKKKILREMEKDLISACTKSSVKCKSKECLVDYHKKDCVELINEKKFFSLLKNEELNINCFNGLPLQSSIECGNLKFINALLEDKRMDASSGDNCALRESILQGNMELFDRLMNREEVKKSFIDSLSTLLTAVIGYRRGQIMKKLVDYQLDGKYLVKDYVLQYRMSDLKNRLRWNPNVNSKNLNDTIFFTVATSLLEESALFLTK